MSFKMAELDRFPDHRMKERGAGKRGGILRSTPRIEKSEVRDTEDVVERRKSSEEILKL